MWGCVLSIPSIVSITSPLEPQQHSVTLTQVGKCFGVIGWRANRHDHEFIVHGDELDVAADNSSPQ